MFVVALSLPVFFLLLLQSLCTYTVYLHSDDTEEISPTKPTCSLATNLAGATAGGATSVGTCATSSSATTFV